MYAQIQKQTLDFGKQLAEQGYKAQLAALKSLAEIQGLQVKTLEAQTRANLAFVTDALQTREIEDVAALWPKGLDYARNSAESAYEAGQQVLGIAQKTAEQIGELARDGFNKAANEVAGNTTKKAR